MAPLFEKFGGSTTVLMPVITTRQRSSNHKQQLCDCTCNLLWKCFGEYVSNFSKLNADLICIMTNDGWWKDTQDCKQHMSYARLEAVKTIKMGGRKGQYRYQLFHWPYGNVVQQLGWDKWQALKQEVAAFTGKTSLQNMAIYCRSYFRYWR